MLHHVVLSGYYRRLNLSGIGYWGSYSGINSILGVYISCVLVGVAQGISSNSWYVPTIWLIDST